jgi:general secretion pathway protein K
VLQACLEGLDAAGAQQLVRARAQNHFRTLADVTQAAGLAKLIPHDDQHSVGSRYFSVRARLRLDGLVTELRTVLRRDGLEVNTLAQTRGVPLGRSLQ